VTRGETVACAFFDLPVHGFDSIMRYFHILSTTPADNVMMVMPGYLVDQLSAVAVSA
jgi:hypothetical protein